MFVVTAPQSEEEVPIHETPIETMTLEGHDISPEQVTPETTEVISMETTREEDEQTVKEEVTFEIVTPERSETTSTEVTVDETMKPLPDESKVAPTATATEVSMATGVETEEVIPREISPVEVSAVETESPLLQPTEQLPEQRQAPQEEVQSAVFCCCFFFFLMQCFTIQNSSINL